MAIKLTDAQREALDAVKAAFPDTKELQAAIAQILLIEVRPLPKYSARKDYQITDVTTVMAGSFAWAYGVDSAVRNAETGRMGDVVVALVCRGDTGPNKEMRYGALGGFTNLDYVEINGVKDWSKGEQPKEGAARELREEAIDDKGKPILTPTPDRMELLITGHDYRRRPATNYSGHALELTGKELAELKQHSQKLAGDEAYRRAAQAASHGEVTLIEVKPLQEVLQISRESFSHPHEWDALSVLQTRLQARETSVKR